ncbi:MAG: amidase family protein [Gemmatimonadales bacterium]|jgi:Asp-tRNA(Asn)/Glu-tRNA(Gln) amidotransferase A subunit family amidase
MTSIRDLLRSSALTALGLGLSSTACTLSETPQESAEPTFDVVEASIGEIHAAMRQGQLTARQLVDLYLERIDTYDKRGPAINAIITVNPSAITRAEELDSAFAATGQFVGPLHGIPVIVKDNYDTHDLPTTAGSASLAGSIPPDDAFQVRRIRAAGAIVLAKSNMAEFAFSPYQTLGSSLPGHTLNPYALNRVPAGSSGGTAAAVAASFGAVGLGTDTGNSIRGPSSHTALVGIRSTMGLTSRDGIVPLYLDRDIGGPMARTVADAVAVLDVIAGYDPQDPITAESRGRRAERYADFLRADGLSGARIGVVRQISNTETADAEILERFEAALETMRRHGAIIVDPADIREQDEIPLRERWCPRFRHDINVYLASLGPDAPVKSLEEIIESGRFHPSIRTSLDYFRNIESGPDENEACQRARRNAERLKAGVRRVMDELQLDALVHPTWSNPPRLIGDLVTPPGDNSQYLAPHTGFPAITVPMGFVRDTLPVGLQIIGEAWSEPRLIAIAYSYEQATQHRRPPSSTPPLR